MWQPTNGMWFVIPSSAPSTTTLTQWGIAGDVPVQMPRGLVGLFYTDVILVPKQAAGITAFVIFV